MVNDSVTWRNFKTEGDVRAVPNARSLISIALQSQYSHSEKYRAMGQLFQDEIDASPQLDSFYRYGLDPRTATGAWLDWWGKRVGASRTLNIGGVDTLLDDDAYRFLIFYRALCNISGGTSETTNRLLTKLMGHECFVIDHQDMTMDVYVYADLTAMELAIIREYGVLNRPAGVKCKIIIESPDQRVLGFRGQELQTFNTGVFHPDPIIIEVA